MTNIGIIGASGYTGEELLRVLSGHPEVNVLFASSESESGRLFRAFYPHLGVYGDMTFCSAQETVTQKVDLVFLCTPSGKSAGWAKQFAEKNIKVIDLAADFRFVKAQDYEKWYGDTHPAPEMLENAVYGLPEWNREAIRTAPIVGNPGCYPTCVLLALLPFLRHKRINTEFIIADAKSGLSGAGKALTRTSHFVEANENLMPYKAGRAHRHVGEIEQELSKYAGEKVEIVFTPHLTPMSRGLYATIYCQAAERISKADLLNFLSEIYADEPFITVLEERFPATRLVAGSNMCFLSVETVPGSDIFILFSAIDNLGKGASWQAVQNMNVMLGYPEEMALLR